MNGVICVVLGQTRSRDGCQRRTRRTRRVHRLAVTNERCARLLLDDAISIGDIELATADRFRIQSPSSEPDKGSAGLVIRVTEPTASSKPFIKGMTRYPAFPPHRFGLSRAQVGEKWSKRGVLRTSWSEGPARSGALTSTLMRWRVTLERSALSTTPCGLNHHPRCRFTPRRMGLDAAAVQ
jgi:hypothetical protein